MFSQRIKPFFAAKSTDDAMNDYIIKVKQLLEQAGLPA